MTILKIFQKKLTRDADRLSDSLPKSESLIKDASTQILSASRDIKALQAASTNLEDIWKRSEALAASVGETAGEASILALKEQVSDLTTSVDAMVSKADTAASNLRKALCITRGFLVGMGLACALSALGGAYFGYRLHTQPVLAGDVIQKVSYGDHLVHMFEIASPKERAILEKLYKQ